MLNSNDIHSITIAISVFDKAFIALLARDANGGIISGGIYRSSMIYANSEIEKIDATDEKVIAMLGAYQRGTNPAAVTYKQGIEVFAETEADYTAAVAADAETEIKRPLQWMIDLNYFWQTDNPAEEQEEAAPENTQAGAVYLKQVSVNKPAAPSQSVEYTGTGVDGWGPDGANLDNWHRPSSQIAGVETDAIEWRAFANKGLNSVGDLVLAPWVVEPVVINQTIRFSVNDTGPWHATQATADVWFQVRTANGNWSLPMLIDPVADAAQLIRGQIIHQTQATTPINGDRYTLSAPIDFDAISEIQFVYKDFSTNAREDNDQYVVAVTPWTPTADIKAVNYDPSSGLIAFHTCHVICSSQYGARIIIGQAVSATGSDGFDRGMSVNFMRAQGTSTGRVINFLDIPSFGGNSLGITTVRVR